MPTTDKEELQLLYQITVADLSYFKTQQWNVSYYAFLIQAGLVGVAQLLAQKLTVLDRAILAVLCSAAAIAALIVLSKLQKSIEVRQTRLEAARKSFGTAFHEAWASEYKGDDRIASITLLRSGIVTIALVSLWLIWLKL